MCKTGKFRPPEQLAATAHHARTSYQLQAHNLPVRQLWRDLSHFSRITSIAMRQTQGKASVRQCPGDEACAKDDDGGLNRPCPDAAKPGGQN